MDHAYIEEHGLVERYFRGDLKAEEEVPFEEHFMACAACQERLKLARSLLKGMRAMASEDAVQRAVVEAGLFAWLTRRGRLAQVGLAMAVLWAAFLPSAWLWLENQRLVRDAAGVESPTVLFVNAYRTTPGEPAAVLDLGTVGSQILLAVDAGDDPRFESFRLSIETTAGTEVLRREGLLPNALEVLMLRVPASEFPPGDYRLRVSGLTATEPPVELGDYPFRVVAASP